MYYDVPKQQAIPEQLKPIFPWEANQRKPTRVFADELPPTPSETVPSVTTDDNTQAETISPSTPTINVTSQEPLASFSRTNAWDDMPEIDRYIANLPQNRRAKVQVLSDSAKGQATANNQANTTSTSEASSQRPEGPDRRGSIKVTDFPTEIERPSLPVTPAPVRRPSFWGEERDAAGDLPAAEGVPEQSQWDPTERLAELQRRQSEVLEKGPQTLPRVIPSRQLLGREAPIAEESTSPEVAARDEKPVTEFAASIEPVYQTAETRPLHQGMVSLPQKAEQPSEVARPTSQHLKAPQEAQSISQTETLSQETEPGSQATETISPEAESLPQQMGSLPQGVEPSPQETRSLPEETKIPTAQGIVTLPTVPISTPLNFGGT